MNFNLRTVCLAAAVVVGSTAIASAQGGQTDRSGNSMGSQHVGNGGGAMQHPSGTVGSSNTAKSQRDAPNGSPGGAPKAKAGPQGDPSKDEDLPK
jgi:hypothetical protein